MSELTNQHASIVLRLPDVLAKVGIARSTLYSWIDHGLFPPPVQLGPRAVGWLGQDVEEWLAARPCKSKM